MSSLVTLSNRIPEIMAELVSDTFLNEVLLTATQPIVEMAKARAPVAPSGGDLRDSIEAKLFGGEGIGVFMLWYGIYAEHGTINEAPHPFLVPAAEAGKFEVSAAVAAWLRSL